MIENLSFKNFRGIKNITFTDLKQITLISGKNNSGKSSVLEGVFLFFDHISPDSFVKLSRFRGMAISTEPTVIWNPLFFGLNTKDTIKISMTLDCVETELDYSLDDSFVPSDPKRVPQDIYNQFVSSVKSTHALKFNFSCGDYLEEGHFIAGASGVFRNLSTNKNNQIRALPYTQFINSSIVNNDGVIAEWFGKIELEGKKNQVIEALKTIDSSITDISVIAMQGQVQLYAKMDNRLLPLKLAGDGVNKLLFIILSIISNPNSVILIDEIETGFHYSMYPKLWEIVSGVARMNNCQIIATTHSYECIEGAIDGIQSAGMSDDFCYYRIERKETESKVFRYSSDLIRSALDFSLEVR